MPHTMAQQIFYKDRYFEQFKRQPTAAEYDTLSVQYAAHNCIGLTPAYMATLMGSELLDESLKLRKGDVFSVVQYDNKKDVFFWVFDVPLHFTPKYDEDGDLIEPSTTIDAEDAGCKKYHERKDNE